MPAPRASRAPRGRWSAGCATTARLQAWTDERVAARAAERRCPATGTSVAEAWARERPLLTPLPETAPEPFDVVVARTVGRDGLVAFEGRQYSVPFPLVGETVEVRGIAGAVQVLKACRVVALHPRGTERRLLVDQRHYDGPGTGRVIAPPPLGRMGARMQELAAAPVARRSIDLYAALAEVAR
jgi:Mu transposase, C-terminal domain